MWVAAAVLLYLVLALKRVHEGRWWPQIGRGLLLGSGYAVLSSVVIAVVMLASSGMQLRLH